MKPIIRIVTPETEKENPIDKLLESFYGFNLDDYLNWYFSGLTDSQVFKDTVLRAPKIRSEKDYETFLKTLPTTQELEAQVVSQIKTEYSGINDKISEIQLQREVQLKNPELDYRGLFGELTQGVGKRLSVDYDKPEVKSQKDFNRHRKALVKTVARTLEARIKTVGPRNHKIGDIVTVSQALGFNIEEDLPTYFYSGDTQDIPFGSVGEIVLFDSPERFTVRFSLEGREVDWKMHPDEIKHTGKNTYKDLITRTRNSSLAAESVILDYEEKAREKYLELARGNTERVFDAKVIEASSEVQKKFRISDEDMKKLARGEKINYSLPRTKKGPDLRNSFQKLATLTRFSLNYVTDTRLVELEDITSETQFRKVISKMSREVKNKEAIDSAIGITRAVTERQYRSTARLKDVSPSQRLETALDLLTSRYNRVAVRRKMMYNDPKLFVREPFSPPSESHDHVIILQAEYGCTHKCTYCTGNETKLTIRTPKEFREHARDVKRKLGDEIYGIRRVFVDGGNVFRHPAKKLIEYLDVVTEEFRGRVERIAAYSRTEGLRDKSVDELNEIYQHGMRVVYWGVETGSDALLEYVNKKTTFNEMAEAGKKARKSGLKISAMLMPGLGGLKFYEEHAKKTAELINIIRPSFITFLSVNPDPNSRYSQIMAEEVKRGENVPLTDEMLTEQIYDMVRLMNPDYECLVAAYQAPNDKVGKNPVEFRARWQFGDKPAILRHLEGYFTEGRAPSKLIPQNKFNQESRLRKMVAK